MTTTKSVMGLFTDEAKAAAAVKAVKSNQWKIKRVYGPIPGHKISDALNLKKSKVGWFTLIGGIIGFFSGFGLAIFTATRWDIIVGGKPVVALVPFIIVGFEFTILFAVFGNVIGMLTQMKLPSFGPLEQYDTRCSGDQFGILATCSDEQQTQLAELFEKAGGSVKLFE